MVIQSEYRGFYSLRQIILAITYRLSIYLFIVWFRDHSYVFEVMIQVIQVSSPDQLTKVKNMKNNLRIIKGEE